METEGLSLWGMLSRWTPSTFEVAILIEELIIQIKVPQGKALCSCPTYYTLISYKWSNCNFIIGYALSDVYRSLKNKVACQRQETSAINSRWQRIYNIEAIADPGCHDLLSPLPPVLLFLFGSQTKRIKFQYSSHQSGPTSFNPS